MGGTDSIRDFGLFRRINTHSPTAELALEGGIFRRPFQIVYIFFFQHLNCRGASRNSLLPPQCKIYKSGPLIKLTTRRQWEFQNGIGYCIAICSNEKSGVQVSFTQQISWACTIQQIHPTLMDD